ncbi:MAG: hypothetical protein AABZ15_14505, partial [Nitrospirota bacterium]
MQRRSWKCGGMLFSLMFSGMVFSINGAGTADATMQGTGSAAVSPNVVVVRVLDPAGREPVTVPLISSGDGDR